MFFPESCGREGSPCRLHGVGAQGFQSSDASDRFAFFPGVVGDSKAIEMPGPSCHQIWEEWGKVCQATPMVDGLVVHANLASRASELKPRPTGDRRQTRKRAAGPQTMSQGRRPAVSGSHAQHHGVSCSDRIMDVA